MKLQTVVCYSLASALLAGFGEAQTQIDLRTQGKSVNFSGASSTLPSQTGALLPAACQVGATYILTTAAAGQNWYVCTSANQWSVQGTTLPSVSGNANSILSTDGAALIWKALGGDVSGPPTSVTVNKLLGRKLNTAAPSTGQLLGWDGTQWSPQTVTLTNSVASIFGRIGAVTAQTGDYNFAQIGGSAASSQLPQAGGDLSGAITSATVAKIQTRAVASTAPATGQVLVWSGTQWAPQNQTGGGGVASVFGRSGAVTAQAGDYAAAQITNAADTTNFNSYSAGARQTFLPSVNAAGIQIAPGPLPAVASAGDLAVDSADSNRLKVYNGSSWVILNPNITFPPGNYVTFFTSQTSISVLGITHGLGSSNLLVQCYDNATPANLVEPSLISVDPNSYNVTVVFAAAETGRCVINGYNGGNNGSGSSPAGGAGMAAQLGDFAVVLTSPATLSIGGNCSSSTPCNVRFGTQVYGVTAAADVALGGGNGIAYIYVDATGRLTVGSTMTITCGGSCVAVPGVTGFPINSMPLYTWTAANAVWDSNGGVDLRGWLSANPVLGGAGIATVIAAGQTTVSVDGAVVPTYLTASATLSFPPIPAATCSSDLIFSLLGANPGDAVAPGWPSGLAPGLSGNMRISAAGVVSVRLCADSTGAVSPASATFTATVVRGF